MTLQQLRYFCVMARILHYTKAAKVLYISQPSLSYALSELERELGVPLFEKQGRQTFLTKYGKTFLTYAQNALDELTRGTEKIEQLLAPTINLGYLISISTELMPKIIGSFYEYQGNRNISFNFVSSKTVEMVQKLTSNELDLAFTAKAMDLEMGSAAIFEQELYLVVPNDHVLAKQEYVDFDDFKNEKFITINPNSFLRKQILDYFNANGVEPDIIFAVNDCSGIATYVSSKMGIAIMPLVPLINSLNLSVVRIKDPPTRTIYLLWNKNIHMRPAVKSFYDFVVNIYPQMKST